MTENLATITFYPPFGTDSNPGPRKCKVRMLHTQTQIPVYLRMFLKIHMRPPNAQGKLCIMECVGPGAASTVRNLKKETGKFAREYMKGATGYRRRYSGYWCTCC
jgi:hypothetical protein